MQFCTPFHIHNGIIVDCNYKELSLTPARFRLSDDREKAENFLLQCEKNKVNLIHLEFTESLLTEANGALKEGEALSLLDDVMEECFRKGFYLIFTPITEKIRIPDGWSENAIREDEPIYGERYFDALFRHVNPNSGKMFFEYENLAGIEWILDLETFTAQRLYAYLHHMGCFVQHFFMDHLLEVYMTDRGVVPEELRPVLKGFTQLQMLHLFPEKTAVRIPAGLPGIPQAKGVRVLVREKNSPNFLSCPLGSVASKSLYDDNAHANGGLEGFVTLEADCAMEFHMQFPCEVRCAKFRPSLKQEIPLQIRNNTVRFTLEKSLYGVLEVNYGVEDLPHFTIFTLMDPVIAPPAEDFVELEAGRHETLDYTAAKTLVFKAGVHYLPEDRLRPVSGHDIYLEPGAVLKCGLTCEKGENVRIYGSGIFDGTLVQRKPGENWKGRADDAFIHFFEGNHILWDGPMIYNSPFWNIVPEGTCNMTIRHHKALTWAVNSDGVQPRSCVNLRIEKSFFKCSDDAIAIKTRRASGMHSHHIEIRDIVTWNDAGSSLEIGHTSQGDLLDEVLFEDIQVIRTSSGFCHIYLIDHSTVEKICYRNLYLEGNIHKVPEISFTISQNFYSTDDTRAKIRNIRLKNLHVEDSFHGVRLKGFDADHRIENVILEDLYIHHGKEVRKFEGKIHYFDQEFADDILYK